MSITLSSGLVGVSTQISLVSGRSAARDRVEVGLVDEVVGEPEAGQHLVDQPVGAAVEVERQDQVVAGVERGGEQRVGGGHPAREGAPWPPSSSPRARSSAARVGFAERE